MLSVSLCSETDGQLRSVDLLDCKSAGDLIATMLKAFGFSKVDQVNNVIGTSIHNCYLAIHCAGQPVDGHHSGKTRHVTILAYPGTPGSFVVSETEDTLDE